MEDNKRTTASGRLNNVHLITLVGVMAAFTFAANWISFPIPTPIDNTRLHLGNVLCLLAGMVLGPIPGGLAAGFGGMFYDFTNPLYVNEAWITFLLKFAMAFLCGKIAHSGGAEGKNLRRNIIAALSGALFYVVLYLGKNFIMNYLLLRLELTTVMITLVQKGLVSLINGVIAVVIAVPLNTALQAALGRTRVLRGGS